jgi:hypothetical protein
MLEIWKETRFLIIRIIITKLQIFRGLINYLNLMHQLVSLIISFSDIRVCYFIA